MPVRVKYPRTPHLPWSPGRSPDDLVVASLHRFRKEPVVVTEKRDGENTTLYADGLHARSTDSRHHPSRSWVKQLHASIRHQIPDGWRICGENLYARHSIAYTDLALFFEVFSVWNGANVCLAWETTLDFCRRLGLQTVPEIYRGPWDEALLRRIPQTSDLTSFEGYVVRVAGAFEFGDFPKCVAKWVRAGHVQTDEDWLRQPVVPNLLRSCGDPCRPMLHPDADAAG